jgi:hypothetical protein
MLMRPLSYAELSAELDEERISREGPAAALPAGRGTSHKTKTKSNSCTSPVPATRMVHGQLTQNSYQAVKT